MSKILYLNDRDVQSLVCMMDPVDTILLLLRKHAERATCVPDEAYLSWETKEGDPARSLNMPGYIGGSDPAYGTKIINSSFSNIRTGKPRASGLTLLFNGETAEVECVMSAGRISALRTASVSAACAYLLGLPSIECLFVIGSGVLAQAHLSLLSRTISGLRRVILYDLIRSRAESLASEFSADFNSRGITIEVCSTPEGGVRASEMIVPVTTTTEGYIPFEWIPLGCLLVNISLDDLLPDVFCQADLLVVDDYQLVRSDSRRILGRLISQGVIGSPRTSESPLCSYPRYIDAELGEIALGVKEGRRSSNDIVVVNPFGMSIEDIYFSQQVFSRAKQLGVGVWLDR